MILDTNFIIEVLRNNQDALNKLKELREKREPVLVPPGALYELYSGADSENAVKRIENDLEIVKLTPSIEKEAARIRKNLKSSGKPISSIDYLIVGTARHHNEKILTNDQHFKRVENVSTEEF